MVMISVSLVNRVVIGAVFVFLAVAIIGLLP